MKGGRKENVEQQKEGKQKCDRRMEGRKEEKGLRGGKKDY